MSFTFGNPATTTQPQSLFGALSTTQSTPSTGFSFGTSTTGAATGFGTGLGTFGAPTTTSASTGFTGFGFGSTAPTTTTTSSLFGGFGGATTSASPFSFPTATTSASTGFRCFGGGGLGTAGTGQAGGLGGFGQTGASTFGPQPLAGNPAVQAGSQDPNYDYLAQVAMATSLVQIFGDERDAIIAKWNQLQANWGTGKGYYSANNVVDFRPENHFCRFKALGYHLIPKGSNEQGQVALVLGRKESEVMSAQQQIMDTLHKIMGSRPTFSVCVEGIKPLPEDKTEVVIYVLERPPTGPAKRVTANELFSFLNQPTQRSQVTSQLNMETMLPLVGWTEEQIKEYLDKAPLGVDPLLWHQAKLDNPDPSKYIPVPMTGFKELQKRLKFQAEQTRLYQQRLDVMSNELTELQTQHSTMLSKLEDYKRKDLELGHRLLKVLVKQEIYRKMGYGIQVEEETLKVQLEQLQAELNHPTQFKGRLNELMSQMRMQLQSGGARLDQGYAMDNEMQTEIRQMLNQQQEGLQHLISIIKEDAEDLRLIEQGMAKPTTR